MFLPECQGDKGAEHLCDALTFNSTLKELSVSFCHMGEAAGR